MNKKVVQALNDPRNLAYSLSIFIIIITYALSLIFSNSHFSFQTFREIHLYNPYIYMAYGLAIMALWAGFRAHKKYGTLQQTLAHLRYIEHTHNQAQAFAEELSEGNYNVTLDAEDSFAQSLLSLRNRLHENREAQHKREEEDKQRNWTSEGLAKFGDILRTDRDSNLEDRAYQIISHLVNYLDANQGGLFIKEEDENQKRYFKLLAAYAYNRKKYLDKKILLGEGLVGATAQEKKITYLTDIPDNYVNITSGLGHANPKSLLIVPLKIEEEVFGVVELASFNTFAPYQIAFVEKVGENIASTISNLQMANRTEKLLAQSQQQAEELAAQEEELRQNMEEMQATQESLQESQAKTQMIFQNAMDAIITIDKHGHIDQFNPSAERLFGYKAEEVYGKNVAMLMPKKHSEHHDAYIDHYHRTGERRVLGIPREVEGLKKDGSIIPIEIKIEEARLGNEQMFVGMIRDITHQKETREKAQRELETLQQEIARMKSS
ncbi:MAG: PAS domain S-box protein [Bacteroidales bacterium]